MARITRAYGEHVQQRLLSRDMGNNGVGRWFLERYAYTAEVAQRSCEHSIHRVLSHFRRGSRRHGEKGAQ